MAVCRACPAALDGPNKKICCKCQASKSILLRPTKTFTMVPKKDIPHEEAPPKTSKVKNGSSLPADSEKSPNDFEKRSSPSTDSGRQITSQRESKSKNSMPKSGPTELKIKRHQESQTKASRTSPVRNRKNIVSEKGVGSGSQSKPSTKLIRNQEAQVSSVDVSQEKSVDHPVSKKSSPKKRRAPEVPVGDSSDSGKHSVSKALEQDQSTEQCSDANSSEPFSSKSRGSGQKSAPPSKWKSKFHFRSKSKSASSSTPRQQKPVDNTSPARQPQLSEDKQIERNAKRDGKARASKSQKVIQKCDCTKKIGDSEPLLDPEKSDRGNKNQPVQVSIVQVRPEAEAKLIEEMAKVQKGGHAANVNTIIVPAMGPADMSPNVGNLQSLHEVIRAEARSCNRGLEDVLSEVTRLKRDVRELREMCEIFLKLTKGNSFSENSSIEKHSSINSILSGASKPKNEEKVQKKKFWKKFSKLKKVKAANSENGTG